MPREPLTYGTPRWDGDCGYCAAMGIPPGMTIQCQRCGQTVCFGHTTAHEPLCEPMGEYFAERPFGWESIGSKASTEGGAS